MDSRDQILVFAREALGLPESLSLTVFPFDGRGSDRAFFRLRWTHTDSAILIHYDPERSENTYYAAIARFLIDMDIPVPRLIYHDPSRCLILMEDLGDTDLWSLRKLPWENRRILYEKTLAAVHKLHCIPEKNFPPDRVTLMESFGPDLYRWERNYFVDHFVRGFCGIKPEPFFEQDLEGELSNLAERLTRMMHGLIHRDLQSQNVMIRDGNPFLIDFQGMRFGSPFYDLGSLLCDPYINFSESERNELLFYYYDLGRQDLDWAAFQNAFWEASAQRLTQALGAYGFLGLKKGLKSYLDHIPPGLKLLQLATSRSALLPRLQDLAAKCQQVLDKPDGP